MSLLLLMSQLRLTLLLRLMLLLHVLNSKSLQSVLQVKNLLPIMWR